METLILAVEAGAGVLLAALLGVAAARARPDLAPQAGRTLGSLLAGSGLLVLLALPLHPLAALFPLAFLSGAWAVAPLPPAPAHGRTAAWASGLGAAAALAVLSALDLWWSLPLLGLLVGTLLALWRGWRGPGAAPGDRLE